MVGYTQGQVGLSGTSRYVETIFSNSYDHTQDGRVFERALKWLGPRAIPNITPSVYIPAPMPLPAVEDIADPTPEEAGDSLNPLESIDESLCDGYTKATPVKQPRSRQEKKAFRKEAKKISRKERLAKEAELRNLAAKPQKLDKKRKKSRRTAESKAKAEAKAQVYAAPLPRDMDMKPFPGRVFQLPRYESKHFSSQLCECKDPDILTLWTDGSMSGDGELAGAAVAYRDMAAEDKSRGRHWKDVAWKIDGYSGHIGCIELSAIAGALDIAITKVSQETVSPIHSVFICSDSLEAIGRCQNISRIQLPPLDSLVHQRAQELVALGVSLSIVWSPGHSGIQGNIRAHIAAGAVTKSGRSDEKPERVPYPPTVSNIRSFTICRMP
ncbi:Ff.00g123410.m01.CDS01 [Fusarium sp. VM40]|nr:Ff.00g123410.m01.CDS01 [Fusarium sp. VM40]